jgi:hypothetical protein
VHHLCDVNADSIPLEMYQPWLRPSKIIAVLCDVISLCWNLLDRVLDQSKKDYAKEPKNVIAPGGPTCSHAKKKKWPT